jgi:SAM-dependent methyltransferase
VECDLKEELVPVGINRREAMALNKKRERILGELASRHGISIRDVFDQSGIGEERNAIAASFVNNGKSVVDVATGRGYFAFAAARRGSHVTAVDVMDGSLREGWWDIFLQNSKRLGVSESVSGIRSEGSSLPVEGGKFGIACCVHAIRNLLAPSSLKGIVTEMRRVLKEDGEAIIVESAMEPESPPEEVYVSCLKLRARIGWESIPPSGAELERLMGEAGFSRTMLLRKRFRRDYAPIEFPRFVISKQPPRVREEYNRIERLRSRVGIKPPAALIVSGRS